MCLHLEAFLVSHETWGEKKEGLFYFFILGSSCADSIIPLDPIHLIGMATILLGLLNRVHKLVGMKK